MPATLGQLRTRAQGRADMENDGNVGTSVWNAFINSSRQRLRRILVAANTELFLSATQFTLTGGASSYAYDLGTNVPTFWKSVALDKRLDSNPDNIQHIPLFMFAERGRALDVSYRVFGDSLEVRPAGSAAGNYTLWYIPQPATMSDDNTDKLTQAEDMWSEFIVLEAAIKARRRQRRDTNDLLEELKDLIPEIKSASASLNAGEADRVIDVDGPFSWRQRLPPP